MLAATPWFLFHLGADQYGRWMLLMTLTTVGSLVGLGMGPAAIRQVSKYHGRNELPSAARAVRALLLVALLGGLATALLLATAVHLLPETLYARLGTPAQMAQIALLAGLLILTEQVDGVFTGAIRGLERFDRAAQIEVVAKFATVAAGAAVAWYSKTLLPVLGTMALLTILRACAKGWLASRLLGASALWPCWDAVQVREGLAFGKWTWLQGLGGLFFAAADRLIVGSQLGAEALARYGICLQLAQQIHTLPSAALGVAFPAVSRRLQGEGQGALRRVAGYALGINVLLALLLALPMILAAKFILSLWIDAAFAAQAADVFVWLCGAHLLLALNVAAHYLLLGAGNARFVSLSNLAGGIAGLVASVALIPVLGLIGAAQARLSYAAVTFANHLALSRALRARDGLPHAASA
ncbi:MAG TPA: oligosaccharide flippase family protein [Nevskiales bacterium]|nr:oligosaccharide flippase family protein [Nevskiales bacterium]